MPDQNEFDELFARLAHERSLRKQLLRAQEVAKLGSWELDIEQDQLSCSDMVFRIFEVDREDFGGTEEALYDLIHPDDRPDFLEARDALMKDGGPLFCEHRIVTPAGKTKWVATRAEVLSDKDGTPKFTSGTVQDITEAKHSEIAREQAERDLQRKNALLSMAGQIGQFGGWRYDVENAVLEWSDETVRLHDEPPGTQPTVARGLGYYQPKDRAHIERLFLRCVETGASFDEKLQLVTAAGRERSVRCVGMAERDADGKIVAVLGAFQDITDLVNAQYASAEVSERLRAVLDQMSDAFFLLDRSWNFTYVNSRAEELMQRSRDALLGSNVWELFPEARGTQFQTMYEKAFAENSRVTFEEYFPPLETWFEVSAEPMKQGLAVYFRDITEQRARQEQLRLLENAAARLNDVLVITKAAPIDKPDGPEIVYVNDAFEERTGYSRAEAIGNTPRMLQGPKTEPEELIRIRKAIERGTSVKAELTNYKKNGEEFCLDMEIVPLKDESGRLTHWVGVSRDTTETKTMIEALSISEERLRLVTQSAGTAVWEWNPDTNLKWWSGGLKTVFGHPPDNGDTRPSVWRRNVEPDDLSRVDAAFDRLLEGQDSLFFETYGFRRADGTLAVVEDRAFTIRNSSGKVVRVLGSLTDVTEKTELETRLRQSQKMEIVGQMTGGIAHDFNNLLTIIMGNAELLEERLDEHEDLRKIAKMTLDAALRGATLTSELLAFSRKQALQPKVIDVAALIQGLDGLLRQTLPETIDIEIVRSGGLWNAEVDEAQLESAILNLALNSRDAMPDGGRLTVEAANATLDEDYTALEPDVSPGQYVVIIVTDNGSGMPPEVVDKVFEPFFTTKDVGLGSGLGLSMVYGFVKQSGGHIRVYSEPGEGTSFKLYFPRSFGRKPAAEVNYRGRKIESGKERILVAEDDEAVRRYVCDLLRKLGYEVLEASKGSEALNVLKTTQDVDLLFTDVYMPGGMDGRDLAKEAREIRPDIRVLYTSGYTENSIIHNGRLDQGVKLLSKPYRRDQLAAKIREVLDE